MLLLPSRRRLVSLSSVFVVVFVFVIFLDRCTSNQAPEGGSSSCEAEQENAYSSIPTSGDTIDTKKTNKMPDTNGTVDTNKRKEYLQDGPEAKEIAQYLPYFPFKGIPRFYDIGGFLYQPEVFQKIVNIFVERYSDPDHKIDVIAGLDARGFILGPPIALALKIPFIMMRKKGKMPNSVSSEEYNTEYGS